MSASHPHTKRDQLETNPGASSGHVDQAQPLGKEVIVMVMGCTGAGKSTLFSSLGATSFKTGDNLNSETRETTQWTVKFNGSDVTLVDTPGFGDTVHSETHTLKSIVTWLVESHAKGRRINGIIYVHRITDNRMSGQAVQSVRVLESLCGTEFMKNIVLCTSFWDVVHKEVGERRELELRQEFWKTLIENGAVVVRHDNSKQSAEAILAQAISNEGGSLEIQKELTRGITLQDTSAGKIVQTAVERLEREYAKKMQRLEAAMAEEDDEAMLGMIRRDMQEMKNRVTELQEDKSQLTVEFHDPTQTQHNRSTSPIKVVPVSSNGDSKRTMVKTLRRWWSRLKNILCFK